MTKRPTKRDKPLKPDLDLSAALERRADASSKEIIDLEQKVKLTRSPKTGSPLAIYYSPQGLRLESTLHGNDLMMSQAQMSALFGRDQSTISRHLKRIEQLDGLPPETLYADSAYKGANGQTFHERLYTVDAINYVGFRVNSPEGIMFRKWASGALSQIIAKGFYIDEERLKNPDDEGSLSEFKAIARRIRTSIQNSYREVLNLCKLCSDYDGSSDAAREFFMKMENKLLWASANKTAPQLILERANADQLDMGLTYYAGKRGPTQKDVVVGNNYLAPGEQERKQRATEMWLTYVEDQLDQGKLPTMTSVVDKLDGFIKFNGWQLLTGRGAHSRGGADSHALQQLELYRERLKSEAEAGKNIPR
jgi:hypothetical protein